MFAELSPAFTVCADICPTTVAAAAHLHICFIELYAQPQNSQLKGPWQSIFLGAGTHLGVSFRGPSGFTPRACHSGQGASLTSP